MINENQFKKEKKNLLVLVSAAWVLCVLLVAFLAVPFTMKIYQAKDVFDKSRLEFDSIKSDLANRDKYLTLRESIGESKDLLEKAVLKETTVVNFIQDLESTAETTGNGIVIAPYTPPKTKKKANTEAVSSTKETSQPTAAVEKSDKGKAGQYFLLTITGSYIQLLNFIAKLENMGYVFNIESIEAKTKVGDNNVFFQDMKKEEEKEKLFGNVESKIIISFSMQK